MKQVIIGLLGAGLLLVTVASCRKESDALMSYDHDDIVAFKEAKTSFAAKFDVLWNGLNQNYAIWDYEAEHGLDWDAVYDQYYPQFEALDKRETVSDEELTALLQKAFGPLHDGHLAIRVSNHKTGSQVSYTPNNDRIMQRPDYNASILPVTLAYYADPAHGEVETDAEGTPLVKEFSTKVVGLMKRFAQTPGMGLMWMNDTIQLLENLAEPTEMQIFVLTQLKKLKEGFTLLGTVSSEAAAVNIWNSLQAAYSFLNVPGFDPIDPGFVAHGIDVKFALLKGNIAYFRLDNFTLSTYLDDAEVGKVFSLNNPTTKECIMQIRQIWQIWFTYVQQLHKSGELGGVIIDVRSNYGGAMDDSRYVVGSLVPSGGLHCGYLRFKRGTGRYEYSPFVPENVKTLEIPHETITEPIVILVNCQTISMAETSALCVQTLSNGTLIGKRTWGAICSIGDNSYFSYSYAGYVGVENVTPVFGRVPSMANFTLDGKLIESEGISPDIEMDLDTNLYSTTGQDTQLDRALQFIRAGGVK